MPQTLTVHGYRDAFGAHNRPIFDYDELERACLWHTTLTIEGKLLRTPYKLEREDGSGRSWNVYGYDQNFKPLALHVYALRAVKAA